MPYLLDTGVAVMLRDDDRLMSDGVACLDGEVIISIVTWVELEGGVYRAGLMPPSAALESMPCSEIL